MGDPVGASHKHTTMSVVNAHPCFRASGAIIFLATALVVDSPAQLVMSNIGAISAIVENFDNLGSSTTLPLHWRVAKGSSSPTWSSAASQVDFATNSGMPQTNGTYNWGDSGFTNRALGMLIRSTARSDNFMLQIKIGANSPPLGSFSVAYSIKQFCAGAGGQFELYYSTNGSNWNLISTTPISLSNFPVSTGYFFDQPNTLSVPFKEFAVPTVLPNSDIYFRWQFLFSGNSAGHGIDDIWITSFQSAAEPSAFTYQSVSGGIAITGYTGMATAFAIPSYINGQRVLGIANGAFAQKADITLVALPSTITSINDGAFNNCTNLSSITIPASVTNIGSVAFANTPLTSISLGSGVKSIGDFAFYRTRLSSITIPASVTNIGSGAFANTPLTSISLGSGMTSIGAYAFDQTRLSTITFPASVTNIGSGVFGSTPNLRSVLWKGNAPTNTSWVSSLNSNTTIYYLPDARGWDPTYGGRPTQVFMPTANLPSLTQSMGFQFSWTGTGAIPMSVQRSTSLGGPWTVLSSGNPSGTYMDSSPPSGQAFYRAVLP